MLKWTVIFLLIAIVAAMFGFTGIAEGATAVAKIIFLVFLALMVISAILGAIMLKRK